MRQMDAELNADAADAADAAKDANPHAGGEVVAGGSGFG